MRTFEFLSEEFLRAMDDIGRYGNEKYGAQSFHARRAAGDVTRGTLARCEPDEIAKHAAGHFQAYLAGEPHDHFGTLQHQLAAVAFNAMMEFFFAGFEKENADEGLEIDGCGDSERHHWNAHRGYDLPGAGGADDAGAGAHLAVDHGGL